jgi:hypothetical protein
MFSKNMVGGDTDVTITPGLAQRFVVTNITAMFGGSGGGGELVISDSQLGATLYATQPSGGAIQLDQWNGFHVLNQGEALGISDISGAFGVNISGWLYVAYWSDF